MGVSKPVDAVASWHRFFVPENVWSELLTLFWRRTATMASSNQGFRKLLVEGRVNNVQIQGDHRAVNFGPDQAKWREELTD